MSDSRRIATVTQINNYIKAVLDKVPVLQNIWIKGEISNFKLHSSGHIYLTLKDEGSVLKAVMFRNAAASLRFKPTDGTKVLARGRISVYESGGQHQLYINTYVVGTYRIRRRYKRCSALMIIEELQVDLL